MAGSGFTLVIQGTTTSVGDWEKAMAAPRGDLPRLTPEQKAFVKKFGISEEEYARGVLAGQFGEERLRERTAVLGRKIQEILDRRAPGCKLETIVAELVDLRWRVEIETKEHRKVGAFVPRALGDDVVDSSAPEVVRDLESRLLAALRADYSPVVGN